MATDSKSHPYETTCVQAKATNQADHSDSSSQHNYRDVSSQDTGSQARLESQPGLSGNSYVDHELAGLDALEDGQPGERPSYPFTTLIRYAIKGSPKGRLLLEEIYQAIQSRYPFFATAPAGWKNSVRHTLSLMTCFEKIPRLLTEPGKGSYWTVNDTVPHAKPSRVRVRKRKTRADDGNDCPGTPMSTPDSFPPRAEDIGIFSDQVYHNGAPYGSSDGSSRRHSSYLQGDLNRQRVVYRTDQEAFWLDNDLQYHGSEGASTSKHRTRSQPVSERSPHDPRDLYSRCEHEGPVFEPKQAKTSSDGRSSPEETAPINATDYRIALMSELERLRNVIGRREDIDQEWCRLMVERLRGTGLSD